MNPVAVTIFLGMILTVVVYSVLDRSGFLGQLGRLGQILPLFFIFWLTFGFYLGLKRFKRRSSRIRLKGPLFMRTLMNDCLDRTCGELERKLKTPHLTSVSILNDILLDRMLWINKSDCLRFSDVRRQIEGSRLKGTDGLQLACFFQSAIHYDKQGLPEEIKRAEDTILRSRTELSAHLEKVKQAHRHLCTGLGNFLSLLPPDEKRVEKIRTTYRYRPPAREHARRMAFALETLGYLKATRHEKVNPMDRRRYASLAKRLVPELAKALNAYRLAWQGLVEAYEQPQRQQTLEAPIVNQSHHP